MRCGVIVDTFSTAGLFSMWPVNMKFLLCGLVCTLTLIQVPMATAGDVCNDPAITVTVNTGTDARLFYNRSNLENEKYFLGYRAYALSSLFAFAFINKTESVGTCAEPVREICADGKAKFMKWNQSLLMIKIVNVTVNDSGEYKVMALFSDKHYNPTTEKCLQVHHLNVSDNSTQTTTSPVPQSTQVYSPSSSPDISTETTSPAPQSTQVYSPSGSSETTSRPVPQSTQIYSLSSSSGTKTSPVPQSTQVSSPSSSSSGSVGKIVGIVVGVLIFLSIVVCAGLLYWRKCRQPSNSTEVPPYGNITIKSSFGQHDIERIVMAISNASNVIGRFRKGEYRCYKDGFLTETECQEHYSLTVNASGDIIIVMKNISDPYFGSYLISVYRK